MRQPRIHIYALPLFARRVRVFVSENERAVFPSFFPAPIHPPPPPTPPSLSLPLCPSLRHFRSALGEPPDRPTITQHANMRTPNHAKTRQHTHTRGVADTRRQAGTTYRETTRTHRGTSETSGHARAPRIAHVRARATLKQVRRHPASTNV